jgi:hypothetical protein
MRETVGRTELSPAFQTTVRHLGPWLVMSRGEIGKLNPSTV